VAPLWELLVINFNLSLYKLLLQFGILHLS
jgi:hypothetical protein